MLWNIVSRTPAWVWLLLAFLIWLGYSQSKDRQASLLRTFATPVAMVGLSLYGMLSVFGAAPLVWALWLFSCSIFISLMLWLPTASGYQYDAMQRRFQMPGSWIPMVVILCIFITKYAVSISLTIAPSLVLGHTFTTVIPILYGAFSGLMMGRSAKLVALIVSSKPSPAFS